MIRIPYSRENLRSVEAAVFRATPDGNREPVLVSRWNNRILSITDPDATVIVSGWNHTRGNVTTGIDELHIEVLPLQVGHTSFQEKSHAQEGATVVEEQVLSELVHQGIVSNGRLLMFRKDHGFDFLSL